MTTTTMMRRTTNRRFAPSLTFRIFVQSKLYHLKSIPVDFFVSFCYPMPCMFSYRIDYARLCVFRHIVMLVSLYPASPTR